MYFVLLVFGSLFDFALHQAFRCLSFQSVEASEYDRAWNESQRYVTSPYYLSSIIFALYSILFFSYLALVSFELRARGRGEGSKCKIVVSSVQIIMKIYLRKLVCE